MSEGIRAGIKNVRIKGGVHNIRYKSLSAVDVTEEQLSQMVAEMASVMKKYVRTDSYITVEFTKVIGTKVNS